MYRYLCSLGANIEPKQNFARVQQRLEPLGDVFYSAVITTKPVAMESNSDFLNGLFVIETELSATELKLEFNQIEIEFGRDREDPRCSILDRPMDIDILGPYSDQVWAQVPSYLRTLGAEFKQQFETHNASQELQL